jgi:hypothetical protein
MWPSVEFHNPDVALEPKSLPTPAIAYAWVEKQGAVIFPMKCTSQIDIWLGYSLLHWLEIGLNIDHPYFSNSAHFKLHLIRTQGETQMQTQEADGWAPIFINPRGRQKVGRGQARGESPKQYQTKDSLEVWPGRGSVTRSESKQYKGIGRLEDRTGRVVRQAGTESGQARVETKRTRTKRDYRRSKEKRSLNRSKEKRWLTW